MVQHSLLSQGPLRGNASRTCMAQIRAATQEVHTASPATTLTTEVEQFVLDNELDEAASNALHSASSVVQRDVLEQGSLASCREPSAGCMSRIRKAESMYGEARKRAPEEGFNAASAEADVESFIQENHLNDRAAEALRIPPEVQVEVMSQGSLATCRDPNAGCIGRIAKAQAAFKHRPQKLILTERRALERPSEEELNAFVQEHNLSERCVAILHDVPASVQLAVLDQGSLRGCRDASAGCIGRVKKAQQALKDGTLETSGRGTKRRREEVSPARGGLRREVDRFVRDHDLSERAAAVLREQRPEVQEMVLQGGSLRGTRDMSASCMGRIRKAQQELAERSRDGDRGRRRRCFWPAKDKQILDLASPTANDRQSPNGLLTPRADSCEAMARKGSAHLRAGRVKFSHWNFHQLSDLPGYLVLLCLAFKAIGITWTSPQVTRRQTLAGAGVAGATAALGGEPAAGGHWEFQHRWEVK
eukprot:symbB.v1.2.011757.t1/scaffold750.1/size323489/9